MSDKTFEECLTEYGAYYTEEKKSFNGLLSLEVNIYKNISKYKFLNKVLKIMFHGKYLGYYHRYYGFNGFMPASFVVYYDKNFGNFLHKNGFKIKAAW